MSTTAIIRKQEQALLVLQMDETIAEMIQIEPTTLDLLKEAASYTEEASRWHMYELLKKAGRRYVGWYARSESLATSRHYQAFLDAIDALLPESEEGL